MLHRRGSFITIFLIAWLSGGVPATAQVRKVIDGHAWTKMSAEHKTYYLIGLYSGLEKSEEIIKIELNEEKRRIFTFVTPSFINRILERMAAYHSRRQQIEMDTLITLLNTFYSDRYNLKIPVLAALRIVLARQSGDIRQADFWLQEARRQALSNP